MPQNLSAIHNTTPPPEKERSAWIVFAKPEMFTLTIPDRSDYVLPALVCGDAFLFVDRERQVALGVRWIYLIRHENTGTTFYFDRIADFTSPIPLSSIEYMIPDAPFIVWKLEFPKLEKALQLANLSNFKALPEFSADDPACQNFARNLL